MKKGIRGARTNIARYIITYAVCLVLAILTWALVMYAEHTDEEKPASECAVSSVQCADTLYFA